MLQPFLDYLKNEKRYSLLTLQSYQKDLEQFQNFLIAEYQVSNLEQANYPQTRAWIVALATKNLQHSSLKRKISALKSYYKFLLRKEIISVNPAHKITTPKLKEHLPKFIEQKNINLLLDDRDSVVFASNYTGRQEKLIIELLYQTGMRRQELINIQWQAIDFAQQQLKIKGKGNKERLFPLGKVLQQQLIEFRKLQIEQLAIKDSYLFLTDKGEPLYPNFVYRIVKKYLSLCTTATKKSPHVLRHSFATHMSNNGAKLNDIKELMGHASLASTQVYTHNTIEQLKEIYKKAHPKA